MELMTLVKVPSPRGLSKYEEPEKVRTTEQKLMDVARQAAAPRRPSGPVQPSATKKVEVLGPSEFQQETVSMEKQRMASMIVTARNIRDLEAQSRRISSAPSGTRFIVDDREMSKAEAQRFVQSQITRQHETRHQLQQTGSVAVDTGEWLPETKVVKVSTGDKRSVGYEVVPASITQAKYERLSPGERRVAEVAAPFTSGVSGLVEMVAGPKLRTEVIGGKTYYRGGSTVGVVYADPLTGKRYRKTDGQLVETFEPVSIVGDVSPDVPTYFDVISPWGDIEKKRWAEKMFREEPITRVTLGFGEGVSLGLYAPVFKGVGKGVRFLAGKTSPVVKPLVRPVVKGVTGVSKKVVPKSMYQPVSRFVREGPRGIGLPIQKKTMYVPLQKGAVRTEYGFGVTKQGFYGQTVRGARQQLLKRVFPGMAKVGETETVMFRKVPGLQKLFTYPTRKISVGGPKVYGTPKGAPFGKIMGRVYYEPGKVTVMFGKETIQKPTGLLSRRLGVETGVKGFRLTRTPFFLDDISRGASKMTTDVTKGVGKSLDVSSKTVKFSTGGLKTQLVGLSDEAMQTLSAPSKTVFVQAPSIATRVGPALAFASVRLLTPKTEQKLSFQPLVKTQQISRVESKKLSVEQKISPVQKLRVDQVQRVTPKQEQAQVQRLSLKSEKISVPKTKSVSVSSALRLGSFFMPKGIFGRGTREPDFRLYGKKKKFRAVKVKSPFKGLKI